MRDQFYLHFDTMPSGTAQQKRFNSKTHTFFKDDKLINLEREFITALRPHKPKKPSERPIKLIVWFAFDVKEKKLWGTVKKFKDCLVKCGYFKSDAQVVDEHIYKTYAEKATIMVMWEELFDNSDDYIRRAVENG